MNTRDLLWKYSMYLFSEELFKRYDETPDDPRLTSEIINDFLKEKNL